jgi:RHS repeat-associated protein
MRTGDSTGQLTGLNWLFGDHLGSTSITTDSSGNNPAELRYKAWGEIRFTSGTIPTSFQFTGQRNESTLGLYFYNSRWFDPALGRFIQADPVVPSLTNSQSLDRYAYVLNNPTNYVDPSGHRPCDDIGKNGQCISAPGWNRHIDPVHLTSLGEAMAELYRYLRDHDGWWKRGKTTFTYQDFLILMLAYEFSPLVGYQNHDRLVRLLAHTVTHWIYGLCGKYSGGGDNTSCTSLSPNAYYNFISLGKAIWSLYYYYIAGETPTGEIPPVPQPPSDAALKLAREIVNYPADPEWYTGGMVANGHPVTWGNATYSNWRNHDKVDLFNDPNNPEGFDLIIGGHSVTFKYDNFAVLTVYENNYWTGP